MMTYPGIPVLRGLDDETSAFPQAAEGLLSIINPKWQLQKQLIQNTANPEALQALANMEARNPGITQQIYGAGRGTSAVDNVGPDLNTQTQMALGKPTQELLSNPDTAKDIAGTKLGIGTQAQREQQSNEARASQYAPTIAMFKAQAAQFEPAIAQAQLSGDQTRLKMLQTQQAQYQKGLDFLSTYKGELTPEAIERGDIKPDDLNALMSLPIGQHLVQTEMNRYYVTQMQIAAREQMAASTRAERDAKAAQLQDLSEKKSVLPFYLKNNLAGKGFSIDDAQQFMFHGGSKVMAQAFANSSDPLGEIEKSPELKRMVQLGTALGDNYSQSLITKSQPQVASAIQKLTGQLNVATQQAQAKKPKKADVGQFHSEVEQIINRQNTINDILGKPHVKGIVSYDADTKSYKFDMSPVQDEKASGNSGTPQASSNPSSSSGGASPDDWKNLKTSNPAGYQKALGQLSPEDRQKIKSAIGDN